MMMVVVVMVMPRTASPPSLVFLLLVIINIIIIVNAVVVNMTISIPIHRTGTTPLLPHDDIVAGNDGSGLRGPLPVRLPPLDDGLDHVGEVDGHRRGDALHDDLAVEGGVDGGGDGGADGVRGGQEGRDDGDEGVVGVGPPGAAGGAGRPSSSASSCRSFSSAAAVAAAGVDSGGEGGEPAGSFPAFFSRGSDIDNAARLVDEEGEEGSGPEPRAIASASAALMRLPALSELEMMRSCRCFFSGCSSTPSLLSRAEDEDRCISLHFFAPDHASRRSTQVRSPGFQRISSSSCLRRLRRISTALARTASRFSSS